MVMFEDPQEEQVNRHGVNRADIVNVITVQWTAIENLAADHKEMAAECLDRQVPFQRLVQLAEVTRQASDALDVVAKTILQNQPKPGE